MILKFYTLIIVTISLVLPSLSHAQADNEIQVYASPITPKSVTFFELHQNYTIKGYSYLPNAKDAHWLNETLEITRGFGNNFELGFYVFTALSPNGKYEYLGNHIRPRYSFPQHLPGDIGVSISMELGFIRPSIASPFVMDGELRPIFDKTAGNFYFSLNPNVNFQLTGNDKFAGIEPQFKTYYNFHNQFGLGIEYYSALGTFHRLEPFNMQEHLLGPVFDLLSSNKWEMQTGILFGLTHNSNHEVAKLIIGRRY